MGSCAATPSSEWPKVPRRVLKAAQKAGGPSEVYKAPGEDMWLVKCRHGDCVYVIMDEWISSLPVDADPFVNVQYAPAFNLLGTTLCPPNAAVFDLMREACSIVYHYAPLTRESFGGPFALPPIPGPLEGPVENIFVHHAKIALSAIHYRIQHMNQADYPIISGLPRGSYICAVNISWMNAIQAVTLFKP
jgi:hypothetical protein